MELCRTKRLGLTFLEPAEPLEMFSELTIHLQTDKTSRDLRNGSDFIIPSWKKSVIVSTSTRSSK